MDAKVRLRVRVPDFAAAKKVVETRKLSKKEISLYPLEGTGVRCQRQNGIS